MRKVILIMVLICVCPKGYTQINLVHNPSFETHWRCPQYHDLVKYANYWTSINDTTGSSVDTLGFYPWYACLPEYCNICSHYGLTSIPSSDWYYHYPRTGNGMMNIRAYYNEVDTELIAKRDYLQGRLKTCLTASEQYCVTLHVSLIGGSAYAINHIGAYFDDATIDTTTNCGYIQSMHVPQVYGTTVINDTVNWTKIQGAFTATGNEKFITIGNFFDANHTDTISTHFPHSLSPFLHNNSLSWYLIDDVSVIKIGTVANAGNDTTINYGDTIWLGEHVNYIGDSVWHNDNDDYAPVKWYNAATGALIDSNHAGLMVHPDTDTRYVMELDVCGTLSYDTVKVHVHTVGITGVDKMNDVSIYPNPAGNEVNVNGVGAGTTYRLLNTVGVVVRQGVFEQKDSKINMSTLPGGVYVLELTSAGSKGVFRLLKL